VEPVDETVEDPEVGLVDDTVASAVSAPEHPAPPGAPAGERAGEPNIIHLSGSTPAGRRRAEWWRTRTGTIVRWSALAVAFAAFIAVFGIPYSEDTILLWLTAALFVASVGELGRWRRGVIRDWLPLYVVLAVYALLRGYASHVLWGPFIRPQAAFDRWIGFGTAPTVQLQRWLFDPHHLRPWDYAAWTVYMSHFFVSYVVLAVLWKRDYARFRRYLPLFVGLTFLGYAIYVLYPAMPPWMASQTGHLAHTTRIIPLVWDHVGVHQAAAIFTGGTRFDNNIAAMPSLHAAYPMLLLLFFWPTSRRPVRALLVAYVLAMAFTLVYTGEHFVIDELVGWACAATVYFVGSYLLDRAAARRERRAASRPEREPEGHPEPPRPDAGPRVRVPERADASGG
jgi:hypothetical protein